MTSKDEKQIIAKIERGDIQRVSEITGMKPKNCSAIINRPNAKKHAYVMEILEKVIDRREKLVEELKCTPQE